MKITIKTEDQEEKEVTMELWLEEGENCKSVAIMGDDANGNSYVLARIGNAGIYIVGNIHSDTGWPLDDDGRLKLVAN